MAAKVLPGVNPSSISDVSTASPGSSAISNAKNAATDAVTKVDRGTVEKALAGTLPAELAKGFATYFQTCFNYLYSIGATWGSRNPETEAYYPSAYVKEPTKAEFMKLDTSHIPESRMMGSILGNLQEAAKKGWLTPKQAEALNAFLQGRESQQQAYVAKSSSKEGTGAQQDQGQDDHKDEYQAFYEAMTGGTEGVGPGGSATPQAYFYPTSGGGGSSNVGGTVRLGMTGPGGGGTSTGSGAPPSGPGGYAPPPPPPPPPPSGAGMGVEGGTPYDEYMSKLPGVMQTENGYLDSNFNQGDAFYGWFQNLFGSENWYRDFSAKALTELQAIKGAKDQITAQLAGIDPSTPDGAKKLYILQQKMSDVQQSERQIYDNISSAQKANDERKEMIKAIFDMYFQTTGATIKNIGH